VLARFPRVIAVSSDIRNQLVRAGARPENVTVVLNAIDPAAFQRVRARHADARRHFNLPPSAFILGAVGRLEPQKDFHLLISSFAQLIGTVPDAHLVIAGDGSLRTSIQAHIDSLGLRDRVRLLGHVADVPLLHHTFDLFVQSSVYEGTPNSVLEAMALETPVVATDAGGTAEIARHDIEALIVPFQDQRALTAAMLDAIRNSDATARRAAAARRRVETELSFDTRLRNVEAIYDQLIERSA
jgi:glycosyltransferase involved in cell wall biosynthesis